MRIVYTALVHLLRPVALAVVLWRGLGNRAYWRGLTERFGFGAPAAAVPTLWVHAVSLGEVNAAAPLIRALRSRHPQMPVVLTTSTPTGRARAQALFGDSIATRLLPYDTPGAMRRVLARLRPAVAVVMETELWPNLFAQCRRRRIPVVLANARLSQRSVKRYSRFGSLFREVVGSGVMIAAQSAEDADRFIAIGADRDRTRVTGNVKFDIVVDAGAALRSRALRTQLYGARPAWIAGSTHEGEEEMVLRAHAELQASVPGSVLVLVPRHPERFAAVADLLAREGFRFERRSAGATLRADTQVLLVDTVGELASLYGAADVAFVGGSLVPVGGHNLLEPAALGVPVVAGPHQANGLEIARLMMREGAMLEVADAGDLAKELRLLLSDPRRRRELGEAGRRVVEANRGSVGRLLDLIDSALCDPLTAEPAAAPRITSGRIT